ncbi:T9SS type A sorting domain-containing protein [Flavihumibacter stibioxidans]
MTETWGTWEQWPMNNQLYPRNASNKGTVRFKGTFNTTVSNPSLIVYKDLNADGDYNDSGETLETIAINTTPITNGSAFDFTYNIDAGLFSYAFILRKGFDYLKTITNVVAGDIFIVQGQSNAEAKKRPENPGTSDTAKNRKFIRSYDRYKLATPESYVYSWGEGKGDAAWNIQYNVGQWAMRLAGQIVDTYGVPVCILNGSHYAEDITYFMRDDQNPTNLNTNYGRLLHRVQSAGLTNQIKAIFWYQGENDAFEPGMTKSLYLSHLNKMWTDWKTDFPSAQYLYMFQIRSGCAATPYMAAMIEQAELEYVKANPGFARLISTTNLPQLEEFSFPPPPGSTGYSYCHFGYDNGYKLLGERAFHLVRTDLYGQPELPNTTAPDPNYIEFTRIAVSGAGAGLADQVTLYFSKSTDVYSLVGSSTANRANFELHGSGGGYNITNLALVDNRIILDYTPAVGTTTNPTSISYYDHYGSTASPAIVNGNGIGMMLFDQVGIGLGALPVDPLKLRVRQTGAANEITFEVDNNTEFYEFEVERSDDGRSFSNIKSIYSNGNAGVVTYKFIDNKPNVVKNFYRIRAIDNNSREITSHVVVVLNRQSKTPGMNIFPNPVTNSANMQVTLKEGGLANIQIIDLAGRVVSQSKLQLQKGANSFSAGELLDVKPGVYFVRIQTGYEVYQSKVIKK